jgi:intracellular sulfur oxidation DsrE/DsrF family protein
MTPSSRVRHTGLGERDRETPGLYGAKNPIAVCVTVLPSRDLVAEDFPGYVKTVPSGVVQLVDRQAEGWYYIRL